MKKAFTLVELLVVIAIISILAALLLPALDRAMQSAYKVACMSNLKQLHQGTMLFADDHENRLMYLIAGGQPPAPSNLKAWNTFTEYVGLGKLIEGEYVGIPGTRINQSFFCPGHEYHGSAYYAKYGQFDKGRGDYLPGWQSNFSTGGVGWYLKYASGTVANSYFPKGSNPADGTVTFRPSVDEYRTKLIRSGQPSSQTIGYRILITDRRMAPWNNKPGVTWDGAYGPYLGPTDYPHEEFCNVVLVDGAGKSILYPAWPENNQTYGCAGWWTRAEEKLDQ